MNKSVKVPKAPQSNSLEKRINRLRTFAAIFSVFAYLDAFFGVTGFIVYVASTDEQKAHLPANPAASIAAAIAAGFLLYVGSQVLDFLADAGEELLELKWGVQDVRRKIIAVNEEKQTRVG